MNQPYPFSAKPALLKFHPTPISTRKEQEQATQSHSTINRHPQQMVSQIESMSSLPSPVKIGARGTIGSLVSQEIEHFQRLDLGSDYQICSQKKQKQSTDQRPESSKSGKRKKKKKRLPVGGGFLPSICSAVDVNDARGMERITRIGYRSLTAGKKLPG